jgi:hypothetical protein
VEVTDTWGMPRNLLQTVEPQGDDEGREGGAMKRRKMRIQDGDDVEKTKRLILAFAFVNLQR